MPHMWELLEQHHKMQIVWKSAMPANQCSCGWIMKTLSTLGFTFEMYRLIHVFGSITNKLMWIAYFSLINNNNFKFTYWTITGSIKVHPTFFSVKYIHLPSMEKSNNWTGQICQYKCTDNYSTCLYCPFSSYTLIKLPSNDTIEDTHIK